MQQLEPGGGGGDGGGAHQSGGPSKIEYDEHDDCVFVPEAHTTMNEL